jgi:hypothetical protein
MGVTNNQPTKKQEIRNIQCRQVDSMEAKLRFIADNYEEMITQLRIKQAQELEKYAMQDDSRYESELSLWRGSSIEFYVMGNLLNESSSGIRKDINERLNREA